MTGPCVLQDFVPFGAAAQKERRGKESGKKREKRKKKRKGKKKEKRKEKGDLKEK